MPEGVPPNRQAEARRRAADALRKLLPIVAYGNPPDQDLELLAGKLTSLADRLTPFESSSRHERTGGMRSLNDDQPEVWEGHPIVGRSNPLAPPMDVLTEGGNVVAHVTFGPIYEGGPGVVQGGFVLMAFDFVLGRQAGLRSGLVVTGSLSARFLAPTPIRRPVRFAGHLVSIAGRKVSVAGEATVDGLVTATAEGLFIAVEPERYAYDPADVSRDTVAE